VSLHIFDINGRLIETLVQGKIQSGIHEIQWNASGQASGIYFAVLHANNQQKTQKLILLK
jgi:flagellar hook assembly protein FlgD